MCAGRGSPAADVDPPDVADPPDDAPDDPPDDGPDDVRPPEPPDVAPDEPADAVHPASRTAAQTTQSAARTDRGRLGTFPR